MIEDILSAKTLKNWLKEIPDNFLVIAIDENHERYGITKGMASRRDGVILYLEKMR